MSNARFFLGLPTEFKNICLVYPPKIKDIITTNDYTSYITILTLSAEELEDLYVKQGLDLKNMLTPFEYLLHTAFFSPEFLKLAQAAFEFFIHEKVTFIFKEKQILIGDLSENLDFISNLNSFRFLDENSYFDFQNLIRAAVGIMEVDPPQVNLNAKVRAMKAKARERDKIKAKKNGLKIIDSLSSLCCMGIGINPLNIGELSYSAVTILTERYQEHEKYDLDIRSLLAGADSKKVKPNYWIRNLDNE